MSQQNIISVNASREWIRNVTKGAAHVGVSRSAFIRQAVEAYMRDNGLWALRGEIRRPTLEGRYDSQRRKPKVQMEGRKTDERLVRRHAGRDGAGRS